MGRIELVSIPVDTSDTSTPNELLVGTETFAPSNVLAPANGNGCTVVDSLAPLTGSQADPREIIPEIAQDAPVCEGDAREAAPTVPTRAELAASGPRANATKHGARSKLLQEMAAPWREEQLTAIRADLGDDVSTLKAHTINQLGTVLVVLEYLGGNLLADGPLTGKGRQRAALTAYNATLDRFMRLAGLVGLERVAKRAETVKDLLA
jgi:hypothetical protein